MATKPTRAKKRRAGVPSAPSTAAAAMPSGMQMQQITRPGPGIARESREQRFNPLANLTPQRLGSALDSFHAGYVREAACIYDALENRVDIVKTGALKRRKDVSRRPWEIVMMNDDPDRKEEAERHKEALESFFNHLTVTDATDLNVRGGMSLLVRQMMGAQLQKYAVHEIVWAPGGAADGGLRAELKFCPLYLFENRRGRLAYTGINAYSEGALCEEGGWMITVGDGIMEAVSVAWMFRSLSLKDWLNFSEKFGLPGVHGETTAAFGSAEWHAFVEALQSFANDFVIATTGGGKVNLIEAGKTGEAPFKPMVEHMERMITLLFRGSDLSTLSRDNGAGASLQGDETNLVQQDDCELCSETINLHLTRRVIEYVFGEGVEPLAYLQIVPEKKQDTKLDMEVDKHLRELGVPMGVNDVLERYDRTLPDADEELVKGPKSQSPKSKAPGQDDNAEEDQEEEQELENAVDPEEQAAFLDAARQLIAESRITDQTPLIRELEEILSLDNEGEQDRRLAEFAASLPAALDADAQQVDAWESILGTAWVNGLTETDLDNANPNHDGRGRFARKPGGSHRERRQKGQRDAFGEVVSEHISDRDNLKRGEKVIAWAMRNKRGVQGAMWREELGTIDFPWGTPGDASNNFVGGSGLSHILAKHGEADVRKLPEVIVAGALGPHDLDPEKRVIEHGNYRAYLTHRKEPKGPRNWWVLTGYSIKNPKLP